MNDSVLSSAISQQARYFLSKWWWLLLLGPVITGGFSVFFSSITPSTYTASSILLVSSRSLDSPSMFGSKDASANLATAYQQLLTSTSISEEIGNRFEPPVSPQLVKSLISSNLLMDGQFLQINANGETPQLVRDVANEAALVIVEEIRSDQLRELALLEAAFKARGLEDPTELAVQVAFTGNLRLIEPAVMPKGPDPRRTGLIVALAIIAGLGSAIGIATIFEFLDDTIRDERQLKEFNFKSLGSVAKYRLEPNLLRAKGKSQGIMLESYNILGTNLTHVVKKSNVISLVVTSANMREGKSTVLANLATAMAQSGKRTMIVDCDLRRPSVHRQFDMENRNGLTQIVLDDKQGLDSYLIPGPVKKLRILLSGGIPTNPQELLMSPRFVALIRSLEKETDLLFLDSPPLLASSDAGILGSITHGVLLIVDTERTQTRELQRAVDSLNLAKANVLGCVLNKSRDIYEDLGFWHKDGVGGEAGLEKLSRPYS